MTQYEKILLLENEYVNKNGTFNSEILNNNKVLLYIQSLTCGYCKKVHKDVEELANKYYKNGLIVITLIVGSNDYNTIISKLENKIQKFNGVPTYILFNNGKLIKQHSGAMQFNTLENFIN